MDTQHSANAAEPTAHRLISIVPPQHNGDGPCPVQGTKVLDADGNAIDGVTSVVIRLEAGGIWQAQINCLVRPFQMDDVALEGTVVETTSIEDKHRSYQQVAP